MADNLVDQIAAQKLGGEVQQQVQAEAQAQAAPQQAQEKPTQQEQAAEAVSPNTEGDKVADPSFITVDFGDGDVRTLSDQQVRETMKRYRDLNYRHQTEIAPMSPVMDYVGELVNNVRQNGQDVSGEEIAEFMRAATQAFVSNPQMGGQYDETPDQPGIDISELEDDMNRWEDENAVSLPPMYKDAAREMQRLSMENQQIRQMLSQLAPQLQDMNTQAAVQVQDAAMQQNMAARQQAANNLNVAQQRYQLPDQDENDFFNFAFERGYTVEDFVDPQLTDMVMRDFTNAKNSPEMDRLRQMAQRRQAFTGAIGNTPASGGQTPEPSADESFINNVADQFMKSRNM